MSDRALDPRKAPRQKRAQATVKAILEATAQLLVDIGYRKTSTNRIAERAGVSVGSLYQYFPNRESIVIALFEDLATQQMALFEAGIEGLIASGGVGLDTAVRGLVRAFFATRTVEPELSRILLEEVGWTEHVDMVSEWNARATALVATSLRHPDAQVRPVDPELAAYFVVQATFGVLYGPRSAERMDDPGFEEELVLLITRYLEPR